MNKRLVLFLLPLVAIWVFFLAKIGLNVFGAVFGIIGSIFYIIVVAGSIDGVTKAKGEMYLAKKYDEEKQKKDLL